MSQPYYRVTIFYEGPNMSEPQNVFWFENDGIATGTDQLILDAFENWITTELAPPWSNLANNQAVMVEANVDEMTPVGEIFRPIGQIILDYQGSVAGEVSPAAVSAWMGSRTEAPRSRGSKYLPGIDEQRIVNGELSQTAMLALAECLVAYLTRIDAGSNVILAPGCLNRVLEVFNQFIGSGSIESTPAYQRRRKPGVGS